MSKVPVQLGLLAALLSVLLMGGCRSQSSDQAGLPAGYTAVDAVHQLDFSQAKIENSMMSAPYLELHPNGSYTLATVSASCDGHFGISAGTIFTDGGTLVGNSPELLPGPVADHGAFSTVYSALSQRFCRPQPVAASPSPVAEPAEGLPAQDHSAAAPIADEVAESPSEAVSAPAVDQPSDLSVKAAADMELANAQAARQQAERAKAEAAAELASADTAREQAEQARREQEQAAQVQNKQVPANQQPDNGVVQVAQADGVQPVTQNPNQSPTAPAGPTADDEYYRRTNTECAHGFFGKSCRHNIRVQVCANISPGSPGASVCRR